ncbi:hypothetical protein GFS24_10205 [Chitinophaga sp. SYP-B3965]|uniref:hypothetical protein n=1 Tax=Chitinophaga sp. SYP-B3965 TaxID=2663120 RepID=UPI001299A6F2|nr:hypothetical protein [Chitinophaga sp. SYP-B3965]MRG45489.1 hypothetical protein [Chitinophaga sp. SYP-B3965]
MASKNTLKQWFSTGKKPTQGQFAELIESFFHKAEDTVTIAMVQNLSQVLADKVSNADLNLIRSAIGNIGDLQTNTKANLVAALNELVSHDEGLTLLLNDILTRLNGISEDLNGGRFIESTEKGAPGGVAVLDENNRLPVPQMPLLFDQVKTRVDNIETDLSSGKFILSASKGAANGVASLDLTGKIPASQLPPTIVTTVNGRSGSVVLSKSDVGLSSVDNTTDLNKPISTAQGAALNAKANENEVVHKFWDETIEGKKTFTSPLVLGKGITTPIKSYTDYITPVPGHLSIYGLDPLPLQNGPGLAIQNGDTGKTVTLGFKGLTESRSFNFQDKHGTLALTTDIPRNEFGTFTPVLHQYSSVDWKIYRIDTARYARVGNIVTISLEVLVEKISNTNSTPHLIYLTGLPYRYYGMGGFISMNGGGGDYETVRWMDVYDLYFRFWDPDLNYNKKPIGTIVWLRATATVIGNEYY